MSSLSLSKRLCLLSLLLAIPLLALLFSRSLRGYVIRTVSLAARALSAWINLRASASSACQLEAPATSHAELTSTPMSPTMISRRDENERWPALLSESDTAIGQFLVPRINMDLAPFIRCITFRVFMVVFLGIDAHILASQNIQRVTEALTDFDDDGEGTSTLAPEVQHILCSWLPREQLPLFLNHILPAYEALWRIIATLVVNCKDDETNTMRWVMLDFRDNPRERQYRAAFGADERSVLNITEDVVDRITRIARTQHASASTWPLSCIRFASGVNCAEGYAPTMQETLKFAALLAAKIIGQIGVRYGISSNGMMDSQGSPWDQRGVYDFQASLGQVAANAASIRRSYSNSSHAH